VVVVDPSGLEYGPDFVRNGPFLETGPKVMNIDDLTVRGARFLCANYKVALFDIADGRSFHVRSNPPPPPTADKAAVLQSLSCAAHVVRQAGGEGGRAIASPQSVAPFPASSARPPATGDRR
jgi:hypothetical protein